MTKWADFAITGVRYNASRTHIDYVETRSDNGDTIGPPKIASRGHVLADIDDRKTFVTATENRATSKWEKGAAVEPVHVHGTRYLRTDRNQVAKDNLDSLPEI